MTYRGYPLYYGFARDGRLTTTRTNGICPACAARVRTKWRMVRHGTRPPVHTSTVLRLTLATLALTATLPIAHAIDPASPLPFPPALSPDVQVLTATAMPVSFSTLHPSPGTPDTLRPRPHTLAARTPVHLTSSQDSTSEPSPRSGAYDCSSQLP
jgi:hypothetical protein